MSSIYEEVDKETLALFEEVRDEFFPEYSGARIYVLWDTRTKKKKFIAKICKLNDLNRYFTADDARDEEGYDYAVVLDRFAFKHEYLDEMARKRILRHELRHILYNPDGTTRKKQWKLCKHDVEDFYEEIELCTKEGEPRAMQLIKESVAAAYAERDEEEGGE